MHVVLAAPLVLRWAGRAATTAARRVQATLAQVLCAISVIKIQSLHGSVPARPARRPLTLLAPPRLYTVRSFPRFHGERFQRDAFFALAARIQLATAPSQAGCVAFEADSLVDITVDKQAFQLLPWVHAEPALEQAAATPRCAFPL